MSNLTRWDPFAELSSLQKHFFGDDLMSSFKGVNIPTTDVYEKDGKLMVEAHLIISAERHEKEEDKDKNYVVRESSSSFYRRIALPKRANPDKIEAHLEEGVLKVGVPLTALPEPKKIEVQTKKK